MMNAWISSVNQKLFFSRLLLEQLNKLDDPFGHFQRSNCESAVYHLENAYRHHIREVAATYQSQRTDSISSVEALVAELESIDKHPAEAFEMQNLEQQEDSWLNQLLATRLAFTRLPERDAAPDTASPIPLMQVSQMSSLPKLTPLLVEGWLAAMHEMVDRHRELMVEC